MLNRRRSIHKAVKEQLVFMARMKSRTIIHVTGVSQRTVNCVIRLKHLTGSVVRIPFVYAASHINTILVPPFGQSQSDRDVFRLRLAALGMPMTWKNGRK